MKNMVLSLIMTLLVCGVANANGRAPTDDSKVTGEEVLRTLILQSKDITLQHQVTKEKTGLAKFLSDILLSENNIQNSMECSEDSGKFRCLWMIGTLPKDPNSDKPIDTYLISFSIAKKDGRIRLLDNTLGYRIEE